MSDLTPTYSFAGDEVFAIHEGKVIASGTDIEAVESDAVKYLDSLKTTRDTESKEKAKRSATHIVTPNGVKGEIIGRTASVFGEEVTVRFDNGTFAKLEVHPEHNVQWVKEAKTASFSDPTERLSSVLESDFEHDLPSLTARHDELLNLTREAASLIANGAPYAVQQKLDQIRTAAENERLEVKEAIDHLEAADAESFIPSEPFRPAVAEQADLGSGAGNDWLDVVAQDMIAESEAQDYDKLLSEGPGLFVTDLDTGALADAGVVREMALSHIVAKTAGFQGEEVNNFREAFLARAEAARREELATRKETNHKEAAAAQEAEVSTPDDALFL